MSKKTRSYWWHLAFFGLAIAGTAQAQTILKEDLAQSLTTRYVDGGMAGGSAAQNHGRIVNVQKWVCVSGSYRPPDGVVSMCTVAGFAGFFGDGATQCSRVQTVTLLPLQCLMPGDRSQGEADSIVGMVRADDGSQYIAVGTQGDRLSPGAPASRATAGIAAAAGAAAAGYYNSCSGSAFDLMSSAIPDPRKNPAEYACFTGYAAHAR